MIYDCFLFNDELDILTIRLNELSRVVDKFVLVESTVSHSCKPKRLFFEENKHLFKEFNHKIIHIIVDDTPDVSLTWIINDYQFCQIKRGLSKCKPTDTVIFGDLDEIPKATTLNKWKNKKGKLKIFKQVLSQYYLNYEDLEKPWFGTRMTSFENLQKYASLWIAKFSKPDVLIPDGGWHFSYIGNIKRIQEKMRSITHQEYNNERYNTYKRIHDAIIEGRDVTGQGFNLSVVNESYMPKYVQEHRNQFRNLILTKAPRKKVLGLAKIYYWEFRRILRNLKNFSKR